jgi:bacillopeptidase F
LGWTAAGQWAITGEASASPTHSWTDSPGGAYGNNWDFSLTSPVLDFSDVAGVTLEFSHIYDLESGWDYAYVETSADGGATWSTAASFNGLDHTIWETVEIGLGNLDQVANARIRFRIDTDTSVTEDGWHIDDIVIRGFYDAPSGLLFRDGFESGGTTAWTSTGP